MHPDPTFSPAANGGAELRYVGPVPVLRVGGTPEEIGRQCAELALRPAARILDYPLALVANQLKSARAARLLLPALDRRGRRLVDRLPDRHRRELLALGHAAGDVPLVVRGNTLFDLKNLRAWRLFGCSSLAAGADRTRTGGPLLARNLDFFPLGDLHRLGLVTVVRGAGVRPFLAIGFPGTVGVFSGINDAGLALATHEVFAPPGRGFDPKGVSFAVTCRRALEECATVDEVHALFRATPRTTSVSVTVCDRDTQAVIEMWPEGVARRDPDRGAVVCANHFVAAGRDALGGSNPFDTKGRLGHLRRLAAGADALDVADAWAALDAVSQGALTLQSMVFEPRRLAVHVALGEGPATKQRPTELRLTDWL